MCKIIGILVTTRPFFDVTKYFNICKNHIVITTYFSFDMNTGIIINKPNSIHRLGIKDTLNLNP